MDGKQIEDQGTAMAKDGTIVFLAFPKEGYEITSVIFDGDHETRKTDDESGNEYILEGIKTDETVISVSAQPVDDGIRRNVVTFEVAEGAAVTAWGENVPDGGTAMAKDGTIIFTAEPEDGYEITSVIFDGDHETRKTDNESGNEYILEGIETDETVISVSAKGPETEETEVQETEAAETEVQETETETETEAAANKQKPSRKKAANNNLGLMSLLPGDTEVATYNFYVDGELQQTQSVADGEELLEPEAPKKEGCKFMGWSEDGGNTYQSFGTQSVKEAGSHDLYAIFENVYYVFFLDEAGNVFRTKEAKDGDIVPADVILPVEGSRSLIGWSLDPGSAETVESVTINAGNVNLYPYIADGHWITYVTGEGASYQAPAFVNAAETTVEPAEPTRAGYTFSHWSLAEGGNRYDFGKPLKEDITLYAVWNPGQANYTVIYWEENANWKNPYLAEDKQDTEQYSYLRSETKTGTVGTKTNVSPQNHGNGFKTVAVEQQIIAGDGSTVVNVYYNREEYTITFYGNKYNCGKEAHSHYYSYYRWGEYYGGCYPEDGGKSPICGKEEHEHNYYRCGGTYGVIHTITAKYGAQIGSAWPSYDGFSEWRTEWNGSTGQLNIDVMPLNGDSFYGKDADSSYKGSVASYYLEVLPGEDGETVRGDSDSHKYRLDHQDSSPRTGVHVTSEDRYSITGFTLNERISTKTGSGNDYNGAKFYYTRNSYDIVFMSGKEGNNQEVRRESRKYQQPLDDVNKNAPENAPKTPDGVSYVFAGWYSDPEGTKEANLSGGMPAHDIIVYAKWVLPEFEVRFHKDTESEEPFEKVSVAYRGTVAEKDIPGLEDIVVGATDEYTWYGWVTKDQTLFNFNTEITEVVDLYPYYTKSGTFKVTYMANGGEGSAPTDQKNYRGNSHAEVLSPDGLTAPDGKVFLGWSMTESGPATIQPKDKILITGATTLYAIWGLKPHKTKITYHENFGETGNETLEEKDLHNGFYKVKSYEATGLPEHSGYTFLGWSKSPGEGVAFEANDFIYVNDKNEDSENHLYAVWKRDTGNLTITKKIVDETGEARDERTFTFTISGPEDYEGQDSVTITVPAGNTERSITLENIPTGPYTVTENEDDAYITMGSPAKVIVEKDGTATVTITNEKKNPKVTVEKTVSGTSGADGTAKVGDELIYTVTVENTGNVDLTGLTLEDNFSVDGVANNRALTWTEGNPAEVFGLAQGETKTFTATYTVQATDNSLSNTAKVGDEEKTVTTPVEDQDAWTVEKTVSGATGADGNAVVGDELVYTVTVENTGNTDLTDLTLEDEFSVDGVVNNGALTWTEGSPAAAFDLKQGEKKTFTATYTVQATDNSLSNTAKVGDETTTIPTPVEDKDAWTVTKTVEGATGENGAAKVGDKLTYTVTVENTGNTDLSGLTLTDEFSVDEVVNNEALTWTEGNPADAFDLAQGEAKTFTATYTVQAADNNLSNTAKVGDETTTIPTPVEDKDAWTVTKTVEGATGENGAAKVGDELTYTVTVKNTGNTDLTGLTLEDEFSVDGVVNNGALTWTEGNPAEAFDLTQGGTKTFTATYTVQATDNNLSNTAKVGDETTTIPTPVEDKDAWTVEKTVSGATGAEGKAAVGDKLTYTVTVTNTGNTDLSGLTLTDEFSVSGVVKNEALTWTEGNPAEAFDLAQGETKTFTATYTVQATDNNLSNTATVGKETTTIPTPVEGKDAWKVTKTVEGATGENGAAKVDDVLTYTVTVENTGNTDLTGLTLTDEFSVDEVVNNEALAWTAGNPADAFDLAQGEKKTFTATYTVQATDNNLSNTAKVGDETTTIPTPVEDKDAWTVTKTVGGMTGADGAAKVGNELTYTVTVKNTGNTDLTGLTLKDEFSVDGVVNNEALTWTEGNPAEAFDLAQGATKTFTATYTVQSTDSSLINTAVVDGKESHIETTVEENPGLTTTKTLTNKGTGENGAFKANETAEFDIVVENTGNTTQYDVVVTETMPGAKIVESEGYTLNEDGTATIPTIEAGKSVTVKAEYTVTQDDIDNQTKLENTATVEGEGPTPDPDPEPIPTEGKTPGLTTTKTLTNKGTGENGAFKAGEKAEFDIVVENTGNTTQHDVVVTDTMAGAKIVAGDGYTVNADGTATIPTIEVGKSVTVKAEYTVTQTDIDNQTKLANTATVKGEGPTPDPDPEPIPTEDKNPGLTTTKTLMNSGSGDGGAFKKGETAKFDIVVENTGNTTQHDVVVTDTMTGAKIVEGEGYTVNEDGTATIPTIEAGKSVTVKAEYTVTQADIDNQTKLANTATVKGEGPTPNPDPEPIPTEGKTPGLTATKTVTNSGTGEDGAFRKDDTATFDITVTNSGNTTQTNVTVSEQLAGATIVAGDGYTIEGGKAVIAEMAPGATVTVKATYTVTQDDIDSDAELKNIALVKGDNGPDPEPEPEIPIPEEEKKPGLTATKTVTNKGTGEGGAFKKGDTAEFDITVTNSGNTTQKNVIVSEQLAGATIVAGDGYTIVDGQAVIAKMAPGATVTVKATYEVTQADIDSDAELKNIAKVKGDNGPDPDPEIPIPEEEKKPGLTAVKSVTNAPEGGFKVDETAKFDIVVENTGNTTQTNVTVTEQLAGAKIVAGEGYTVNEDGTATIPTIEVGDSVTVKAEYTVTQADIDSDEALANVAIVNGEPTPEIPIPEEEKNPKLTSEKKLTNGTNENGSERKFKAGETAEFDIVVENTGNTTQTNVTVSEMEGAKIVEGEGYTVNEDGTATIPKIEVGDSVTVKAEYTVTQADIDSDEALANVATVNGTRTDPEPIPEEEKNPELTSEKKLTNGTNEDGSERKFKAGEMALFDIVVKNTGNTTQHDVVVADTLEGAKIVAGEGYTVNADGTATIPTIEVGKSVTVKAQYTVTQADIDSDEPLANIATVNDKPTPEIPIPEEEKNPGLTTTKSLTNVGTGTDEDGNPNGSFKAGETAEFDIVVKNTGNTTQKNVVVTDTMAGAKIVAGKGYTVSEDGTKATIGEIPVGESVTVKAEYTVTQADIDNKTELDNTATVDGDGPTPDPDPELVPTEPENAGLTATKSLTNAGTGTDKDGIPNGSFKAGETATFDITVTNSGNTTQKNVIVSEQLAGATIVAGEGYTVNADGTATIGEIPVGESVTVKAEYTVTQDDIDKQAKLENIAIVKGNGPTPDPAPEEIPLAEENPGLTVTKELDNKTSTGYKAGDTVRYLVIIENTGNVTLENVIFTDDHITKVTSAALGGQINPSEGVIAAETSATAVKLKPGQRFVVTYDYIVKNEDLKNGSIENVAAATGKTKTGKEVNGSDTETVSTAEYNPELDAQKKVTNRGTGEYGRFLLGDTVTFDITVKNTGSTIQDVTVSELDWYPMEDAVIVAGEGYTINDEGQAVIEKMAPGATVVVKATYTMTQEGMDEDELVNTAEVSSEDLPYPLQPSAKIPRDQRPAMEVIKEALGEFPTKAGETVQYKVHVKNTGNVALRSIRIKDSLSEIRILGTETYGQDPEEGMIWLNKDLVPGEELELTYEYTVTQADVEAGSIENTVTAYARKPIEPNIPLEASDTVTRSVVQTRSLETTKTLTNKGSNADGKFKAGETATFDIVVKNTGNVTQHDVVVTETLQGAVIVKGKGYTINDAGQAVIAEMAPGATVTVKATYTVTQKDIDNQTELANTATVNGGGDTPDPKPEEIPTEERDAHLTVTKTTTSTPKNGEKYALGETITYEITATNDGNVTLTDITVKDELTGDTWTIASLAPSETSEAFTVSHEVTEDDILAGSVLNVATAKGKSPDPTNPDVPVDPGKDEEPTDPGAPKLAVRKTIAGGKNDGYALGDEITFHITVTNTGNLTINDITVTDELTGDTWTIESLAPGEKSETFTATYKVTEADILAGKVVNLAKAAGTASNGDSVKGQYGVQAIPVDPNGHLTVTKTTTSTPANGKTYALGEIIIYSVTVTNDGNLTIKNVKVTDELTNAEWTVDSLEPSGSRTFSTSYTVREEDILAGSVKNVATATGESPDPNEPDVPTEPGTTEDKTDEQAPALKVTKKVLKANYGYNLGDKVRYRVHVENTGNVTLSNVTVTDPLTGDSWTIDSLAPGATESFVTGEYTVTEADILKGSIENTAAATGTAPNGEEVTGEGSVSARTVEPNGHLTITKEATSTPENGSAYGLDETITYTVTATNDGNLTLTNITVTDELTGDTWTIAELVPGESESFTAEYTVTEEDVLAGHVLNEATATGTSPDPDEPEVPTEPGEDDEPVQTPKPNLFVEKTVNKKYGAELGEELTFTITVTNNGNVTIENIKVSDELTGNINGKELEIGTLKPGESEEVTVTYTVTEEDILAMVIINTAVAAGTDPNGNLITREGKASTSAAAQNPELTVEKRIYGSNYGYKPGDKARYRIIVTNTGNVTLTNVTVTDDLTGESWTIESLAPGAVENYRTKEYTVTEKDVMNGKFTNTAAAQGKAPGNIPITAEDSVDAETVKSNPHMTITKETTSVPANGKTYALGERITYEVTVTNDGNLTLTDVVVTDELTKTQWTVNKLAPGESRTFKTSYVVTEKDLEGEVVNTATGTGVSPDPKVPEVPVVPGETEDPTDPRNPGLTTAKTLTNSGSGENGAFKAGETATFDIVVENTGNTTQHDVVVTDTMSGAKIVAGAGYTVNEDGTATIPTIEVGKSVTVKAEYKVTQEDIDNQTELANTATVDGEGPTPDPDPEEIPTEEKKPGLTATKKLTNAGTGENGAFKANETATFDIVVENTGNTTQTNVVVTEQLAGAKIVAVEADENGVKAYEIKDGQAVIAEMAPGAVVVVKAAYEVTQADIDSDADLNNIALVKGDNGEEPDPTPEIPIPEEDQRKSLSVTKTVANLPESGFFKAGETAVFDITVTNTGNTTQKNVTVTEQLENAEIMEAEADESGVKAYEIVDGHAVITEMAPGATVVVKAAYTVTQADIDDEEKLVNIAAIGGGDPTEPVPDPEVEIPKEPKKPGLMASKAVTNAPAGGFKAGETAEFDITVTNTGNTTQTDVVVAEQLAGAEIVAGEGYTINEDGQAVIAEMAPNATVTVKAEYTVTQEDIDSDEELKNIAKVGPEDGPDPGVTIPEEPKNPALTSVKTVENKGTGKDGAFKAGETAEFNIAVTNSGNTTQKNVIVTEQLEDAVIVPGTGYTINDAGQAVIAEMAPKAMVIVKATYTVTQEDIDSDAELKNIVLVEGDNGTNPDPTPETEIPEEPKNPGLITEKTLTNTGTGENGAFKAGETAAFDITVTNSGNTTQTDVVVTEQLAGAKIVAAEADENGVKAYELKDGQAVIAEMAPGAVVVVKATYTVTQEDIDSDEPLVNIAKVEGDNGDNPDPTPGTEIPEDSKNPGLTAEKTLTNAGTGKDGAFKAGETAAFDITVTNTGNTTQTDVVVTEQLDDAVIVPGTGYTINDVGQAVIAEMAPGAMVIVKATYTVTQEDIDSDEPLVNIAKVEGDNGEEPDPTPETEIPEDPKNPGLTAVKTVTNAPEGGFKADDIAEFAITVTNSGNTTQKNVIVTEKLANAVIVPGTGYTINDAGQAVIAEMAPNAVVVVKATYQVTQADIDSDAELKNVALADGDNGTDPDPTPEIKIPEENQNKSLSAVKTVTNVPESGFFKAGETAEFEITVTNTGNTTQKNVVVSEQLAGATIVESKGYTVSEAGRAVIAEMAPKAVVVVKATYTVTQADIDNDAKLVNIAAVGGGDPTEPVPDPEVEIPEEPKNPGLAARKTVTNAPEGGFKAGETAEFNITVTNTGNTTQTDVVVAEQLAGARIVEGEGYTINKDGQAVIAEMAPDAVVVVKAEYTVTQEDIDSDAELKNIAKVGPEDGPDPGVIIPEEPKNPALTSVKTLTNAGTGKDGAFKAGETAEFAITVTNSGNTTQTNVTVTEQLAGAKIVEAEADENGVKAYEIEDGHAVIAEMAPGAEVVVKATYTVTQEDIDSDAELKNIALVEGDNGTNPDPEPEITIPTDPKHGHVTITKTTTSTPANGEAYVLGETITYSIKAENDGNLTVTNVVVTDELTGDEWTIESLAPGASETFTAEHTVTEADILAGSVVNVATAKGTTPDPDEPDVPADPGKEEDPTEPKNGHVTITKTTTSTPANGAAYAQGETITYEITAKNDGNLTVTNVVVTDELTGDEWTIESLAPGASETFTAEHVVTAADASAGRVLNAATATGTSPDPDKPDVPTDPGEKEDPVVPPVTPEPPVSRLFVEKTAEQKEGGYALGDEVAYTIRVVNNGETTISNITVTDPLTGDTWTIASLAAGASETFTANYTVTEADVAAGSIANVATASGTAPDGSNVETEDSETVTTEERRPELSVEKTVISTPAAADGKYVVGETITYQVTVTNTGNLTVENVTVEDIITRPDGAQVIPDGLEQGLAPIESLAPGASAVFTYSHTVTEADLGGNLVNNVAVAGTPAAPDPTPETPDPIPGGEDQETVVTEDPSNSSITVSKTNVDGMTDALLALPGAEFHAAVFSDEQLTQMVGSVQAITFGEGQAAASTTFTGLKRGTYYIAETDEAGNVLTSGEYNGGTFTPEYASGQQVVIAENGQTAEFAFRNLFAILPEEGYSRMAELTITKKVQDTSGKAMNSNETFYAGLFQDEDCTIPAEGVSQQIVPIAMNGGSSASAAAEVTILNDGSDTVLYVAEVTADGVPVEQADDFAYESSVDGSRVAVNMESPEAAVTITNTADEMQPGYYMAGELTITKEVRDAQGGQSNSDETFYAGIFSDAAYTTLADNVSQQIVPLNMQGAFRIGAAVEVTVPNDGSDTTLYVTEVTADGEPVAGSRSFAYEVSVEGGTVVMSSSVLDGSATIINTRKSQEEPSIDDDDDDKSGDRTNESETERDQNIESVRTGDETPVMMWTILFLAAALAMILAAGSCFRRRRNR